MSPLFETSGKMTAGIRKTSRRPAGGVRRHQCWIVPRIPPVSSRRPSWVATHESTPTRGWACSSGAPGSLGSCWPLIRSYLLDVRRPEQAARPDDHDDDQEEEHVQVVERGALGEIAGR